MLVCEKSNQMIKSAYQKFDDGTEIEYGRFRSQGLSVLTEDMLKTNDILIFYVHSGQGIIWVDNTMTAALSLDLLVLTKETSFVISNTSWEVYYCRLNNQYIYDLLIENRIPKHISLHDQQKISIDFHTIYQSIKSSNKDVFIGLSACLQLLSHIQIEGKNLQLEKIDFIRKSVVFIEENFHKDISIDDFVHRYGYSMYYFIHKFKESIGKTPYEYIIDKRIQKAKLLLQSEHVQIDDVFISSGFQSKSNFYYLFKKYVGVSPNVYRKKYR